MAKPPVRAQELAASLAAQIRSGEITPGSWLPSERNLAETHQVSRSTARTAVQILTTLGLASPVPGAGAQVIENATDVAGMDALDLRGELGTIRQQLAEIMARLGAIEAHSGLGKPGE